MRRSIVWEWCQRPGIEHLLLTADTEGSRADGVIVAEFDGSFRLRYAVTCDAGWRFRDATLDLERAGERRRRSIARDTAGRWTVDGAERPDLAACTDIDIMGTPFTNTLPLRRLTLAPEEPVAISVAYIRIPDIDVTIVEQDYTRRGGSDAPARFRYRNLPTGFTAELSVDPDGVVIDYGEIWRRRL
jgi:uncharacterized protein